MEYILTLLVAVLIGLIGMRKWPKWGNYYWSVLGIVVAYQVICTPYRVFRVLYDLGHLLR